MAVMAVKNENSASTHFGRQMRKERLAHGWTLREFSARTGVDIGQASRIETGKQPPTEKVARACDAVWPERRGWFLEYYEESKSWTPAGFRSWGEYEDRAVSLRAWSPGVLHGLVQTEAYARAMLETASGATAEMVSSRLTSRMERQKRVLMREEPPMAWFIIDELSLYREVGSAQVMAEQMRYLADIAAIPTVVVQVLPAVAHPAGASGFIVADDAAYAEHVAGGYTFTEQETVTSLLKLFNTIHSESFRASESLRMLEGMEQEWMTGVSPLTRTPTAGTA